jgi:hypothetical protein
MLKSEPLNPNSIYVHDKRLVTSTEEEDEQSYLQELKQIVFDEVIKRIELNMDIHAADILDAARSTLQQLKDNSKIVMFFLKPICLLFLFEIYLEVQVNI